MKFSNVSDAFKELPSHINYYVMCASYEDRSHSLLDNDISNTVDKFKLFYYEEFQELTLNLIRQFENKYSIEKVALSINQPIALADAILECFKDVDNKPNVVIDISTFTREGILIFLKFFCLNKSLFSNIYLFYRSAMVSDQLSSIIVQIRSVLGYMGELEVSAPTHLILLSGFESYRAKEMIDTIEPEFISISYGDKDNSISNKLQEINETFTESLISYYSNKENLNIFQHSLVDINRVKEQILAQVIKYPTHNFIVIPLSNKLSTIGAGLAALECEKIQICYSQVEQYNVESYSKALDECFIEQLDFDCNNYMCDS